jgi:hypothetical protein
MQSTSQISFLSGAEKLTLFAYEAPREYSIILSEVISRLAAMTLSAAAALDILLHSSLILPTCVYAIGKSIYLFKIDFTLPWQHIQRIRNAVSPLILGSLLAVFHPFAGIAISEPTDKHIALGILSSHSFQQFETPCSPIHSLSIIEDLAQSHPYALDHRRINREIFSSQHVNTLKEAKTFEKSLESLQAQEFMHKITNITLFVMAKIFIGIENSYLDHYQKAIFTRLSGVFIPILTVIDMTITIIAQTFFLLTGLIRSISGRGPIYTEVTTNPLMHVTFFIQNILKVLGNLIGTAIWFIFPSIGFKASVLPSNIFFKLQMTILMIEIRLKMLSMKDKSCTAIPIVFGDGECSAFSLPTHSMHKTYLIVEKRRNLFNLYWVNRPSVQLKANLDFNTAQNQIRSMLDERYPFMDLKKLMNYPVRASSPELADSVVYATMERQGNRTNCVISNLFGMLEIIDKIQENDPEIPALRNKVAREYINNQYNFYSGGFSPFQNVSWDDFNACSNQSI